MIAPSEVRLRVLEDHARLREDIEQLRLLAARGDLGALSAYAGAFFLRVKEHMEQEERLLLPVLRSIDAWGDERAARLLRDHAAQRAWIASNETSLATCASLPDARARVLAFIIALEDDMRREEERDLCPELLSDLPPAPDLGGHID